MFSYAKCRDGMIIPERFEMAKKSQEKTVGSVPRVIIIRGTPGTGKSTIAQKVASLLKGTTKKAYIPIDNVQHLDLRNGSKDKFKLGIFHTAILCRSFIQEGFNIVVDYVFDADLDFFIEKLFRSHATTLPPCKVQVFYIDAEFETIKKRNKARRDPMPLPILKKLYETCNAQKGSFPGEVVIDSTKLSPKGSAKIILDSSAAIVGCKKDGTLRLGEL